MQKPREGAYKGDRVIEPILEWLCGHYKVNVCFAIYNSSVKNEEDTSELHWVEYHKIKDGRFTVKDNNTEQLFDTIHDWCLHIDKKTGVSTHRKHRVRLTAFHHSISKYERVFGEDKLTVIV